MRSRLVWTVCELMGASLPGVKRTGTNKVVRSAAFQRDRKRELAPDPRLRLHLDVAAVAAGDLPAQEQAEPRARDGDVLLRRQPAEAGEQQGQVPRRDAQALVTHAHEPIRAAIASGDPRSRLRRAST